MRVMVHGAVADVKAAKPRPMETPPTGYIYAYDPARDEWDLVKQASEIDATLLSEFRDTVYPNRPTDVHIGSKVYIKATKKPGEVIRISGTVYKVQDGDKVVPCFRSEIEPLAD